MIDDTIVKFQSLDEDTWVSQWECKRPGQRGRIYSMFSEENNGINDWVYNPQYETIAGVDLGFTNPAVMLIAQVLPNDEVVVFDEFYKSGLTSPQFVHTEIIPRIKKYNISSLYIDPSGADEIEQLQQAGYSKIVCPADNSVDNGISIVRSFISSAMGAVRLRYVKKNMPNFHREMTYYHSPEDSDKPVKEDDHCPDAIRYMLYNRFSAKKKRKFGASS
ncbi:Terminase-like family protein [compost metagenome]